MTNSMMTTTVMQTSRAKRLVTMLERLLKQDHLYTDEQIKTMIPIEGIRKRVGIRIKWRK